MENLKIQHHLENMKHDNKCVVVLSNFFCRRDSCYVFTKQLFMVRSFKSLQQQFLHLYFYSHQHMYRMFNILINYRFFVRLASKKHCRPMSSHWRMKTFLLRFYRTFYQLLWKSVGDCCFVVVAGAASSCLTK